MSSVFRIPLLLLVSGLASPGIGAPTPAPTPAKPKPAARPAPSAPAKVPVASAAATPKSTPAAPAPLPPQSLPRNFGSRVVDFANALTKAHKDALVNLIAGKAKKGFPPFAVLVVPALSKFGRRPAEAQVFAEEVRRAWALGAQTGDDGVLVLLSLGEPIALVDCGPGVPGHLASRLQDIPPATMLPLLKKGRGSEAAVRGLREMMDLFETDRWFAPYAWGALAFMSVLMGITFVMVFFGTGTLGDTLSFGFVFVLHKILHGLGIRVPPPRKRPPGR